MTFWGAIKGAWVCTFMGHPFLKGGNPFARCVGLERCLRCGCHYNQARGNIVYVAAEAAGVFDEEE